MSNSDNVYYFPWVRKGLGGYINEKESLGDSSKENTLCRAEITIKSNYETEREKSGGEVSTSEQFLEKVVKFSGPGDILKVSPAAIMKVHPSDGEEGFPIQNIPYIEFWEPDFPWRFTPASDLDDKLRPWLSLVVVKSSEVKMFSLAEGHHAFKFIGDKDSWHDSFLKVSEQYHSAHAQGENEDTADFSRVMAIRNVQELQPDTEYTALLIPTYETGRLRGLGFEEEALKDIAAQKSSWDDEFESQKSRLQGFEFPVYHHWSFKTGNDNFDTLVAKIAPVKVNKPGILLDVTNMGEGFDYDTVKHASSRNSIVMPAVTLTPGFTPEAPFPAKKGSTESVLYNNLEDLLSKNPVFLENKSDIAGGDQRILEGDDDPWIVPPVYGARHAMSTELHDKEHPWIDEVNMDIHNRAAAGLGRQVVQTHQEELVNRAWKQIDAVQALNMELYKRLLSYNTNKALKRKTVDKFADEDNEQYIEYLMRYHSSMKNTSAGATSLS
ncbi:MAG: hypothetical protein MJZ16_11750, partial [Bacteroidales bacterium]|nr:hypothetical protein [Bacteroidales bacterium]